MGESSTGEYLAGQVAIVTGSARGIGRGIALALARRGADVVVSDIEEGPCSEVAAEIAALGRRALAVACNVARLEDVQALVDRTVAELGRLDVFVNNAGITRDSLMLRMTEEQWQQVLDVNLKGTFFGCQAAGKVMMRERRGSIVNISSVVGLTGNAGQANYSASKAGVIALTKTVAKELASRNVRVNAVAPGFIETDMTRVLPDEVKAALQKAIPMRRLGAVDDIASVVCFLCSPDASYVTGQCLPVDGGMTMG